MLIFVALQENSSVITEATNSASFAKTADESNGTENGMSSGRSTVCITDAPNVDDGDFQPDNKIQSHVAKKMKSGTLDAWLRKNQSSPSHSPTAKNVVSENPVAETKTPPAACRTPAAARSLVQRSIASCRGFTSQNLKRTLMSPVADECLTHTGSHAEIESCDASPNCASPLSPMDHGHKVISWDQKAASEQHNDWRSSCRMRSAIRRGPFRRSLGMVQFVTEVSFVWR